MYRHKERQRLYTQDWRARKKSERPDYQYWYAIRRLYNLTEDQYNQLLEKQNYRCAICKSETPNSKGQIKFHVDHCHTTKVVRGLLCSTCNRGLGLFKESSQLLQIAMEYLQNVAN